MLSTHESVGTAAIVGGLGLTIGIMIGAIVVGRGWRANASASSLAAAVGPITNYDVRIGDHRGGWSSPGPAQ